MAGFSVGDNIAALPGVSFSCGNGHRPWPRGRYFQRHHVRLRHPRLPKWAIMADVLTATCNNANTNNMEMLGDTMKICRPGSENSGIKTLEGNRDNGRNSGK